VGDERALTVAARAGGEEVPDAAAKVGPAQEHVGVERDHHDPGEDVRKCDELPHYAALRTALGRTPPSLILGLLITCL
jgi:hypothetical protein